MAQNSNKTPNEHRHKNENELWNVKHFSDDIKWEMKSSIFELMMKRRKKWTDEKKLLQSNHS